MDGGKDSLPYDKLILATGGAPRRLPIEGANLENVYTFRGLSDSRKVSEGWYSYADKTLVMTCCPKAAQEGKRMVIIGSSFISMELVVAVSKKKLASIDVIGMEQYPFENVLGKEVGAGLMKVIYNIYHVTLVLMSYDAQYHESQGVKFHMLSKGERIVPREDNPNLAGGVVVNGHTIPADFVIMGVGVVPATEFLKGSGIEVEKDGGIRVDEYLRVRSVSSNDVYAIGGSLAIHDSYLLMVLPRRYCNISSNPRRRYSN